MGKGLDATWIVAFMAHADQVIAPTEGANEFSE
jgi:hypothetical protein